MREAFWQGLQEYAKHNGKLPLTRTPARGHCYDVARFGKAGFVLQAIASTRPRNDVVGPHELRLQLKIEADADRHFRKLNAQRNDIHGELGFELTWHPPKEEIARGRAFCLYDGPVDLEDKGVALEVLRLVPQTDQSHASGFPAAHRRIVGERAR